MKIQLIYVTVPSKQEAEKIAETVVSEKRAACANILDGVTSIFEWDETLCREQEAILFLKTTSEQVDSLTERIKELHTYEVPCIVALPIESGNPDFLNWVAGARPHTTK